jgi:hypothetical protein
VQTLFFFFFNFLVQRVLYDYYGDEPNPEYKPGFIYLFFYLGGGGGLMMLENALCLIRPTFDKYQWVKPLSFRIYYCVG